MFFPVAYSASQAWSLREAARRAQLFDNTRPASTIRISHVLNTGACVQEDIVLKHGRQLTPHFVATVQDPRTTLQAANNEDRILTIRGNFTDQRGRRFPYELEVVFARDILQVLWHDLIRYHEVPTDKKKFLDQVKHA